jgi:hypothetical protein
VNRVLHQGWRRLAAALLGGLLVGWAGGCATAAPVLRAPPFPAAPPTDPIGAFADTLGRRLVAAVFAAACMDPVTLRQDDAAIAARQRRQAELLAWFEAKGRQVRRADCTTPADLANFADFPAVMANHAFLQRTYAERLAFIGRVQTYAVLFASHAEAALRETVADDPPALAALAARCATVPQIEARFFGRQELTTLGAVYQPATATMYINLNHAAAWPEEFVDAFEHELWHHLLPLIELPRIVHQPWVEGYTEAVAELWSEALHRRFPPSYRHAGSSIEYPVQVAWVTLPLLADRVGTLRYLTGQLAHADWLARLAVAPAPGPALVPLLPPPPEPIPPAVQARLAELLRQWGWREDDGSAMTLDRFLADGALSPTALAAEMQTDRTFVLDLITALSVVKLQDISWALPTGSRTPPPLPPALLANLRRVLEYRRAPTYYYTPN